METDAAQVAATPGMPQLDVTTFPNQIFWLVLTVVAIYFILSRVALPRISAVLAERQGTLTNDLAAAEDLKRKVEAAEVAYNKALADARAEAARISDETRARVQDDLNDAIARADAEISGKAAESEARIAEIQAGAIASIEEVARSIAGDIVSAVAPGQTPQADAIASAVSNRMKG